jgi:hypothetical protein
MNEILELDLKLTEIDNRFWAKTKEPGTTAEELREINSQHTRLLERFSALIHREEK